MGNKFGKEKRKNNKKASSPSSKKLKVTKKFPFVKKGKNSRAEQEQSNTQVQQQSPIESLNLPIQQEPLTSGFSAYSNNESVQASQRESLDLPIQQEPLTSGFSDYSSNESAQASQRESLDLPSSINRFSSIRMQEPQDPLDDYMQGDDVNSLLYGLGNYRNLTMDRLDASEINIKQPVTIDNYIAQTGMANVLDQHPAISIFAIREALENPRLWKKTFPEADPGIAEEGNLLKLWIDKLVANKDSIGLYDLGDATRESNSPDSSTQTNGSKKIGSKDRLGKNDTTKGESGIINSDFLNSWLDSSNSFREAISVYNDMSSEETEALNDWIYREVTRRICKLGIDFGTQDLNSKVHFNIAGAIDPESSDRTRKTPRTNGLILSSEMADQSQNRAITISEIRHAAKMVNQGIIPGEKINTYNEFN